MLISPYVIHASIFLVYEPWVTISPEPLPGSKGHEAESTQDGMPVHSRAQGREHPEPDASPFQGTLMSYSNLAKKKKRILNTNNVV